MKIKMLMVGKTTDAALSGLIEEYASRLKHYLGFEQVMIAELKNAKHLTVEQQKEKEADLILAKLRTSDEVILLDEKGKQFSSMSFAAFLSNRLLMSNKSMIFVVGGPYGFSARVYDRANSTLSLSAMTFSHQMIRLLFIEQLYRAMTIIKGEPYHHE